jgi:hypothetical protein
VDDGVWVSPHVIKEVNDLFLGIFSRSCLLCGNVGEGHEDSGVHCPCIVEEAADDLLDSFLSSFLEEWTVICWTRSLIVLAIIDRIGRKGTVLWFQRGNVGVPCELLHYIFGHGEVDILILVVPFKVDAAVEVAYAVFHNFICFFVRGIIEVLEVVFTNVFDFKVVDSKIEPNGVRVMLPQAGSVGLFMVTMSCKSFLEELVGKNPGLREAIHALLNFHEDVSIESF